MAMKENFEQHTADIRAEIVKLSELGDREGLYVWKKSTTPVTITMTQQNNGANPTTFKMSSDDVDLSTVDVSYFVGFKGTYTLSGSSALFEIKEDGLYMGGSLRGALTYDPSTQVLSCAGNIGSLCTWTVDERNEFINYVVSSVSTAYPDGGEQDGYWYELVDAESMILNLLGSSKVSVDKIVFSSRIALSTNITNSLAELPDLIIVIARKISGITSDLSVAFLVHENTANIASHYMQGCVYVQNPSAGSGVALISKSQSTNYVTTTTFNFAEPNDYYGAGVEYTVILAKR